LFTHGVGLAERFDEGIFAGREIIHGSEFEPASADAGDGGFDNVLFLADFAGDLALDVADDAFAVFDFGADDVEAVEGHGGLLGLLRTWLPTWLRTLLRTLIDASGVGGHIGGGVNINVEGWNVDVGLNGGVVAREFDGLFQAGECTAENVGSGTLVDVAGGLLDFDNFRFALKTVEQKYAGIVGQAKSGGDLGELRFLAVALLFDFLVELDGFGGGLSGSALSFVFFGGGPVDEVGGEFLPVIALRAQVADAVAFDLIFCDQLVGAVFEDEAAS